MTKVLLEINEKVINCDDITEALQTLTERNRDIVMCRCVLNKKKWTIKVLARKYNISTERVRQITKRSLRKMKTIILRKVGVRDIDYSDEDFIAFLHKKESESMPLFFYTRIRGNYKRRGL